MRYLSDLYKPKYLQLYEIIKEEINRGKFKKGQRLPSESELTREFNVSSITVRKCIDILKNEGLIERMQGVGTFKKIDQSAVYTVENRVFGVSALLAANEWASEVERGLSNIIETSGGNVFFTDAAGDTGRQRAEFIDMVRRKPDLIYVLLSDPGVMQEGLDLAARLHVPVISVEAYLEGPAVKTHLNADQMVNGIYNANNIIDYLAMTHDGLVEGTMLDVFAPGAYTTNLRHKAMLLKLSEYPSIQIKECILESWTNILEDTRRKVRKCLEHYGDSIDVVTAHFGEPLIQAALAVEDLGLDEAVKVIGIDAFQPVIELMNRGACIIAAVQQDAFAMGSVAAKAGIRLLNGEKLAYQYVLPLANIYANFPNRVDNYPENSPVRISCPTHFKQMGFDWGY
jgi:ABC-type sugar transport system substrate-binding protein